ncbi:hypothetical protein [Actinomadura harenae]|uniref:Uncharacterized protein n=1 Tax=Actinomadura harenae TaxID=2483351 RepID=A0A3M2MDR7_9ACTN|nr:hypothetical protein [Actinomadura harenae]RMI47864.1 hypothetical protein EBO15_00810 [Actinomadura harenae]
MAQRPDSEAPFGEIGERLAREFSGVHDGRTVERCVTAARFGALEVTGAASPDLVERVARKHLQVLAVVAAEKKRRSPRTSLGNTP